MKDRIRISLTLRPEVVSLLDNKIDGSQIRNRSHAVEHFLKQALLTPIHQAIIIVKDEKQSLTKLKKETVIEQTLKQLDRASIKKIIITCPNNSDKLKKFLSKKKFANFIISFKENSGKESAKAINSCSKLLDPGTFLVTYGDIVADIDICDFGDFHKTINTVATTVVTSITDPKPWGIVKVKRNHITDLKEKPESKSNNELSNLINAGIYVLQPEIFGYINEKTKSLEEDVFPKLINQKQLAAYILDGSWYNLSHQDQIK